MVCAYPSVGMRCKSKKGRKEADHETILDGTLGNAALLEALVDAQGNALGDGLANEVNVRTGDALTKGGGNNIVGKSESLILNLTSAEVLSGEGSNKGSRVAVRVELGVDGALVEGSHHVGAKLGADNAAGAILVVDTVLRNHLGNETAGGDDLELGRAGMDVEGVHSAGINAAEGHARAGANKSRESLAVGSDDLAALSGVWLLGIEVEDELVILEKREAVDGSISELKLSCQAELGGVTASPGRSSRGKRGEGQDGRNGSGGKLHCEDDCGDEVWKMEKAMEKIGDKVGVKRRRRC